MKRLLLLLLPALCGATLYLAIAPDSQLVVLNWQRDTLWWSWAHRGTDSAGRSVADSGKYGRLVISGASVADTGRMLNIRSIQNIAAPSYYGAGLQDATVQGFYAGHKPLDSIFIRWCFSGTPDTFQWKMGRSGTYAKKVATTSLVHFVSGCSTKFGATTGHTVNDSLIAQVTAPYPLYVRLANGIVVLAIYPDGAISEGYNNTASGTYSTVGGGQINTASGTYSTVGGGYGNTASGIYATVGGGYTNTASGTQTSVGGGYTNTASGTQSTVGGGYINTASGAYATVPGGTANNDSAPYSVALGDSNRVRALDTGAILIGGGRGLGRLTSSAPWQIRIGWRQPNLDVYEDDSVVTAAYSKTIVHGPVTIDSAFTLTRVKVDSARIAADTSTFTIWIGSHSFTWPED